MRSPCLWTGAVRLQPPGTAGAAKATALSRLARFLADSTLAWRASKARAFQALTGGGMDAGAAAAAAGLEVQAMARTAFRSNCEAFLLYPQHHSQAGSGRFGECRRRAPAAGTDNRFRGHATWPMVKATEWCEEHVEVPSE